MSQCPNCTTREAGYLDGAYLIIKNLLDPFGEAEDPEAEHEAAVHEAYKFTRWYEAGKPPLTDEQRARQQDACAKALGIPGITTFAELIECARAGADAPVTKDGKRLKRGSMVYHPNNVAGGIVCMITRPRVSGLDAPDWGECYSTREAAEAARASGAPS